MVLAGVSYLQYDDVCLLCLLVGLHNRYFSGMRQVACFRCPESFDFKAFTIF